MTNQQAKDQIKRHNKDVHGNKRKCHCSKCTEARYHLRYLTK